MMPLEMYPSLSKVVFFLLFDFAFPPISPLFLLFLLFLNTFSLMQLCNCLLDKVFFRALQPIQRCPVFEFNFCRDDFAFDIFSLFFAFVIFSLFFAFDIFSLFSHLFPRKLTRFGFLEKVAHSMSRFYGDLYSPLSSVRVKKH